MTTRSYRRHRNPQKKDISENSFFPKTSTMVQTRRNTDAFFQAKDLTIGKPGDKYEVEADKMADAVVNHSSSTPDIQQREISTIQRESLATPLEDEKMGTAEQRMEEDKLIQEKPEIQRMDTEEEEMPVQEKHEEEEPEMQMQEEEEETLQMQEEEEEEEPGLNLQTKSNNQAQSSVASAGLSQTIQNSREKGKSLSSNVKSEMESGFGVDFSDVNIHTDATSNELNNELHAQAFTHGKDIYFNSGKFQPETSHGKHLLAHELTHVVQQTGGVHPKINGTHPGIQAKKGKGTSTKVPVASTCGKPANCPSSFCSPFPFRSLAIAARNNLAPILLAGIAAKVNPRVVPLWSQYLFGGRAPQNLSGQFGQDFTNSVTTTGTTSFLVNELKTHLLANRPKFLPGQFVKSDTLKSLIPRAIAAINTSNDTNEMNFNAIGEIPGNIAGGIGITQLSCPVGAKPSPFNDARLANGHVLLVKQANGSIIVFPFISYSVKDTIDLCPGNCGAQIEQLATIPMSMMEASGISGDVPFTVNFLSNTILPFTIPAPPPETGNITASSLRIRKKPNLRAAIIGSYPRGDKVVLECKVKGDTVNGNDTWFKTNRGFISGAYVQLNGHGPSKC